MIRFQVKHVLSLVVLIIGSMMPQALGNLPKPEGSKIKCIGGERQALLKFKEDLDDAEGVLSSWGTEEECCKWRGVHCDNETNQHLNYLDLSSINLPTTKIPDFIGHLSILRYLNLSGANLVGAIPHQLGNLSKLQYLDLGFNVLYSTNLDWLYTLHSLKYLDLNFVNLSLASNWFPTLTKAPLLQELYLQWCELPEILPSSRPTSNFSSLAILDLSGNDLSSPSIYSWMSNLSSSISYVDLSSNNLQGSIPDAFGNMASLSYLSLSFNKVEGGIPRFFGNLSLETLSLAGNNLHGVLSEVMNNLSKRTESKLKYLDISGNRLNGPIPDSITRFSSLIELRLAGNEITGLFPGDIGNLLNLSVLYLSENQLSGTLPESIGGLSKLESLYLGLNHFEGIISEAHLFNLSRLRELDLSFNSFKLEISPGFVPPFQLDVIQLARCKQGPQFPEWIQTQHNFSYIDISSAEISDTIPDWFWDLSPRLVYLNFSYNQIYGVLPDLSSKFSGFPAVDLSSNNLEGTLPPLPPSTFTLNLFQNRFSGSLESLCNTGELTYLDLSDNQLSGQFPKCFQNIGSSYIVLNLANNNLSGSMFAVGSVCGLSSLNLRNNSFVGEIPQSFRNCMDLQVIDLGENKLSGSIPAWIGDNWSKLVVLSLKSNELYGEIPSSICHMAHVQILDLSLNKINGTIPKCFDNLTAMAQEGSSTAAITLPHPLYFSESRNLVVGYDGSAFIMWKGEESEYTSTLGLVKIIDLSSNHLTGEIPIEITSLVGLVGLNVSRNSVTGSIPPQVGQLHLLNFLDLSRNRLSGGIPTSLSQLTHLGVLDVSYNNLSGRIPLSTQLQTFNASAYIGNSGLCGPPVTENCPGDAVVLNPKVTGNDNEEDTLVTSGFYISLGLGFIIGFLGICGSLLLNKSWRHTIFKVDSIHDWLY